MPRLDPTAAFADTVPHRATVRPGERFGRICLARYPDPLGYGKTASRFSDPRRRVPESRFAVLYLGKTLKVCFLETVLRDQRNGVVGDYLIAERELHTRRYVLIEPTAPLELVDLRGDGCVRMGIPSDVPRSSNQALARRWSLAFYHSSAPDGIVYASRLNGDTVLAIYDRAIAKLRATSSTALISAPGLAAALDDLRVAVAP